MELDSLTSVSVGYFAAKDASVKVVLREIDNQVLVEDLHKKVLDKIGVNKKYHCYFAVMMGKRKPTQKLKLTDYVPSSCQDLFLYKWCFDLDIENQLLEDDVTCDLIYYQALHDLQIGHLTASIEEQIALDELSSLNCSKSAFVRLCQRLAGYNIVVIDNCFLSKQSSVFTNHLGNPCKVTLSQKGLCIITDEDSVSVSWSSVKQWSIDHSGAIFTYTVLHKDDQANNMFREEKRICVESKQLDDLLSTTHDIVKSIQKNCSQLAFYGSMINMKPDGTKVWTNPLFGYGSLT
ncbi:uncharacterized protein LOC106880541 isoform X1 [Octopus bimaculoides]|uniref:FERM domain-containing protein n=2 Tax=Octopus bimaculoides TaxID=37653 RepID=A0A0L8FXJ9_OCTBM|nr:uncharacterized protein LOC106880541 isoform X1 [Octopus bimaculoides]|eukprot:XP_014786013.1 PREDICTED: uncharacterized protein LOC106880541 isoform X1 [Octopus bimaculoides]